MIDAAPRTPRIEFTPCDPHAYSLDALAGSQSGTTARQKTGYRFPAGAATIPGAQPATAFGAPR